MKFRPFYLLMMILSSSSLSLAQEAPAANGKFVNINGCKIYYEETGQGEPLLLVYGFGGSATYWKKLIPEFSKKYRVIAWDMRDMPVLPILTPRWCFSMLTSRTIC